MAKKDMPTNADLNILYDNHSKLPDRPSFGMEFINLYRSSPCLWDKKDKEYTSYEKIDEALLKLLEVYKKYRRKADIDSVKTKINNMRANYNRELKKVTESKESGVAPENVYVPSLWYFKHMTFLTEGVGEETSTSSTRSKISTDSDTSSESDSDIEVLDQSYESKLQTVASYPQLKKGKYEAPKTSPPFEIPRRASDRPQSREGDNEYTAWALNAAAKLHRMKPEQALICEKIMTDALFMGLRGELTMPMCNLLANLQYYSIQMNSLSTTSPSHQAQTMPTMPHQAPTMPNMHHQAPNMHHQAPTMHHQAPSTSKYQGPSAFPQAPGTSHGNAFPSNSDFHLNQPINLSK